MGRRFDELQATLTDVMALNVPGGREPHVLVLMPSFSLGETTFLHYAELIPALEHRYLTALPLLERVPGCEMVYLCTSDPGAAVLDYHLSLVSPEARADVRRRFRMVSVPDHSARPLAPKLLDRPDVLDQVRRAIGGRPAYIEPWNVTDAEVAVAEQLGVAVLGTSPDLWPLGFKSPGRRLFRAAGVPVPLGEEDVRSVEEVCRAIEVIRATHPDAPGAVIKHDNSGSGDGNATIRFGAPDHASIRGQVEALPDWYLQDLRSGGVVEELIAGDEFTSPSAQIDLTPDGTTHLRATHEQILGGPGGQTFMGCRFPARPEYAHELAIHAAAVGEQLASHGVVGRVSVDFAAARGADGWKTYALEMNLRKGGTTHPYAALRNLVPGRYDAASGQWRAADGTTRCYVATDSVADPAWVGLSPSQVVDHLAGAGLGFDHSRGVGVVLHMLSALPLSGRLGMITIGRTPDEADELTQTAIGRMATVAPDR
jgi:hypothetical protein